MALNTISRQALRRITRASSLLAESGSTHLAPTAGSATRRHLHSTTSRSSAPQSTQPHRPQPHRPIQKPNQKRTLFIQTSPTPNADALKFIPGQTRVLPESFPAPFLEYLSARATLAPPHPSPLAAQLFEVDGVTAVFYGEDYITVTKDSAANWGHVKPEVFALITQAVTAGDNIVNVVEGGSGEGEAQEGMETLAYNEEDSEVVSMIKELLETRIRPAIQEDGGDIEFRGLKDGWVMLKLRGACRTCDSSTVTLRNGIESMLMHYIEEVKGVQQVLDQEEEVAMAEFAKFEEKLRQQKGPDAVNAKGALDDVPG